MEEYTAAAAALHSAVVRRDMPSYFGVFREFTRSVNLDPGQSWGWISKYVGFTIALWVMHPA